jgi:hypothetical protein
MSYSLTDYSATEVELNDGLRSYYYKKCYCSVELQGEYIVFTSHKVENNAYRQSWTVAYTDFTTPTGSAATVLAAIKTIIENYAGGGTPTPTGYYGMYQDVLTQTIAVINTGYPIKFRTLDLSNGVSVVSDSRITFANTGIYNLQFSVQLENSDTQEHDVTIWLRLNGVDVPGSAGFVAVVSKHGGINGHVLPSWNYLLSVVAGQYYELVWSSTSTQVTMPFIAAGSPPPSTASAIFTVTQQAGIMAGTGITAINSLTGAAQTLATNGSGTDFNVSSVGSTHTFNLPTASATNRGALSSADWSTFNGRGTSWQQYRKAGRWYNNGIFTPANAGFTNLLNTIRYVPVYIDQDITITRMGINVVTAAAAGNTCRLAIYSNDSATCQPLTRLVDAGTLLALDASGAKSATGLSVALTKGLYWFAINASIGSGTITGIGTNFMLDVKGQANISGIGFAGFNQSFTYGAFPATAGTLTEAGSTGTVCIFYYS